MSKAAGKRGSGVPTEHEGMLLTLIIRRQPVTAYQLFRMYEQSLVTSFNTSKGQVYPAIVRLKNKGLVDGRKVVGDGRHTEELHGTRAGVQAAREWVKTLDSSKIVLDDPLRTRLLSFELLSREEQLEWIARAKALVKERRDLVEEYDQSPGARYQELVHLNVTEALRIKMEWLDELLYAVARSK